MDFRPLWHLLKLIDNCENRTKLTPMVYRPVAFAKASEEQEKTLKEFTQDAQVQSKYAQQLI